MVIAGGPSGRSGGMVLPKPAPNNAASQATTRIVREQSVGMVCFILACSTVLLRVGIWCEDGAAQRVHDAVARVQHPSRAKLLHSRRLGAESELSGLPFAEQLRREHGAKHVHPQNYAPLPTADEIFASSSDGDRRRRRRVQDEADGSVEIMTVETTTPLTVHVDWSATNPATAKPYSTCFQQLQWFKWQWPERPDPPCVSPAGPACSNCPGVSSCGSTGPNTLACWMEAQLNGFNPCGDNSITTFSAEQTDGVLCHRGYGPSVQNCWGVCLQEDTLNADILSYMEEKVGESVAELQTYFRVRPRTSNMKLLSDTGVYASWYQSKELDTTAMCAKDTQMLYRLPVADSYCNEGVDADLIFFPIMSQKTMGIGGWGTSSLSDQNGRPVLLLMGWSVPITVEAREEYDARGLILHELVNIEKTAPTNIFNNPLDNVAGSRDGVLDIRVPRPVRLQRQSQAVGRAEAVRRH